ncbi:TetR/AcrR family transcriptional regulator [Paenibacillus nanensis]|uniref:TetR/AcrR family transcriptional regulator n=1 Tax=Paenibacillus nanensis TaxID=393251 RepID=A0A3A1UZX4_9BACL|nr:TetR family transcriptional regulator [Paenibacillus nanensis]RIX50840.1 TetR/AcrR family transcriptional regulator [Paenibacillus nanensis]
MTAAEETDIKIRILQAAKKLFALQGFEGTTIRQICEEAGANVALVSYHFGGKENLFGALFEMFFPNDQLAAVDPDMEPIEGVKLVIREVTKFRQSDPQLISIIQQEIILNTPRIQKIREHVMPMWGLLRKWIAKGREQGVFSYRSLDSVFMSVTGILLFHRNQDYWKVLQEEEEPGIEAMIEDMTDFILQGLHYKGN